MIYDLFALILRYVYFSDGAFSAGKDGLFKAAAVRAIALMLNNVEYLITIVALGKTGNGVHDKLCPVKDSALDDRRIDLLNILGNDERKLTDIKYDLVDLFDIVFLCKVFYGAKDLSDNSDLVHITS